MKQSNNNRFMMMKKISYLAIAVSLVTLAGCGGGGSGDSGMTAGGNNTGNGSGDTKLKCDRGILLNPNLTAKSIFEETLYSINYLDIMGVDSSGRIQLEKMEFMLKKFLLMDKCYIQNIFRFIILALQKLKLINNSCLLIMN